MEYKYRQTKSYKPLSFLLREEGDILVYSQKLPVIDLFLFDLQPVDENELDELDKQFLIEVYGHPV